MDIDIVLFELYEQAWFAILNREEVWKRKGGNKLRTFSKFKSEYKFESYFK